MVGMHDFVSEPIDEALFNRLLHGLFDFSPVAICVSTTGGETSRYVRFNQAYLDLTGRTLAELREASFQAAGVALIDERRRRRQEILATAGRYRLEEVEIRHAGGAILSTLISAQRFVTDGKAYDIEVIVDVTERKAAEAALWRAAHVDALTGIANRRCFIERLEAAAAECSQSGGAIGLALIDLDFFKLVNDRHGHMAGDRALVHAARCISEAIGDAGLVGRLGGDEFGVLVLDATDRAAAHAAIEAMCAALNDAAPPLMHPEARPTVTAGYAFLPDHADAADGLMRAADLALYHGKRLGRAIAVPFHDEIAGPPGVPL